MSQETLKRWRILIPGFLWLVVLGPLFLPPFDVQALSDFFLSGNTLGLSVAAVVLGALYYILDGRQLAWRSFLTKIQDNIKDRLLDECGGLSATEREELRKGRTLMNQFYLFVDRDPSLIEKAKRVRFNGIFLSSLADCSTIGGIGCVVYLVANLVTHRVDWLAIAVVLGVLFAVSQWVLLPVVTRKHLELSDDQLEFIAQHHGEELCDDLRRFA